MDIAQETEAWRPVYLVDLDRHMSRVLYGRAHDAGDADLIQVELSQECGCVAIGDWTTLSVFRVATGERIFECPDEVSFVWVSPLRR